MRFTETVASGLSLLLACSVVAHPGHDVDQEIAERRDFLTQARRADLSHCTAKLKARGVESSTIARRSALLEEARAKRGITKRSLSSVLATSHNETSHCYNTATNPNILFAGNTSCILTPDATQGPFYVGGEYIRRNVIEHQKGVDTVIDFQVIDVNTCDPVTGVYLELWHCNATGVYSGIVDFTNGNGADATNINTTFLRGIQKTDRDGVAQFETIFPGHYYGRATHIHILIHTNVTVFANGTLGNKVSSSHVGQGFFDQGLITAVESLWPYTTNTQELMQNAVDNVLATETATDGVDPFFEYTLLGRKVSDGLFAWLSFGINTTESTNIVPSTFLYKTGGIVNPDAPVNGPPPSS